MEQEILNKERNHLKNVANKVIDAKNFLEESIEQVSEGNLQKLKDLRDNPETNLADFNLFLEQLHQKNSSFNIRDKYTRLDELTNLLQQPFFARIDLKNSNDSTREVYIGKFGYTEKEPIIIDWRAKIASVYYRYRYPQKNVSYDTPDGKQTRDLTLKRTYEISKGELLKYFDNDLQLDENDIISEKIEQRTGGVLEDIVETIQESQLDIIESDPRQVCIVQGCVGSGKSTVAIHKLSHIFFNYPQVIRPERSVVIAKNQILVGYLSTLFPKLGIFDVAYKTLDDLIFNLLYREDIGIKTDLSDKSTEKVFNSADLNKLKEKLDLIHQKYEVEINKLLNNEEFKGFSGFVYSKKDSPYENITEAITDLEEELALQNEAFKETPKSIKALIHKDNIKTLKKLITRLKKIRIDIGVKTLPKLTKEYKLNTNEKLNYNDSLLYTVLHLELIGLRQFRQYEYCVVDEGQDFNILEYYLLGKVVLHGRFSILGDLNQGINKEGISQWDEIQNVIDSAKNAQKYILETNYRSTKPIIDLANEILGPYTQTYLPKSINRKGESPKIDTYNDYQELINNFKQNLLKDSENLDKSIGIICFTQESLDLATSVVNDINLSKEELVILKPDTPIKYLPKGVYLTHFDNCKGLEFSKVYVLDLDLESIRSFSEAKEAFVAVTRAMNELHIFSLK